MEERIKRILDNDVETIKQVELREPELVEALMTVEEEHHGRDELLEWLADKKERRELIHDDELVEHLLSHLEEAYRTAAISENAYRDAKQTARELLS